MINPADIIIAPVVSEKGTLVRMDNRYAFWVSLRANKLLVKEAVGKAFGVKVKAVNIVSVRPKQRRVGYSVGRTSRRKKAYVTLVSGQKIDKVDNLGG